MTSRYLLLLVFIAPLWAQDIPSIVERNPFDPSRGSEEEVIDDQTLEEEVVQVTPENMPFLDGTMVIGSTKIAVFSYEEDGSRVIARAEMLDDGGNYRLHLRRREPARVRRVARPGGLRPVRRGRPPEAPQQPPAVRNGADEPEEPEADVGGSEVEVVLNGKIAGFSLVNIHHNRVELRGNGEAFNLEMYREGAEKSRGGTKKPVARRQQQVTSPQTARPDAPAPLPGAERKPEGNTQQRRPPAPRPRQNEATTKDDLKKKF